MDLPFVRGPLPPSFRRSTVTIDAGRFRPYVAAEWRDALVVVEHGRVHLECHNGGFRPFDEGAVLCLDGLALRALHNRGTSPTVLVAVTRRPDQPETTDLDNTVRPRVIDLPDRPYLGLRRTCTTDTIDVVADRIPEIIGRLAARGVAPAGPPFLRYHVIDTARELDVEAGVPVDDVAVASDELTPGVLPAGRFVVVQHIGDPDGLLDETAAVREWAATEGLEWDMTVDDLGEHWGCRSEHLLTHPSERPHRTEISMRLAR